RVVNDAVVALHAARHVVSRVAGSTTDVELCLGRGVIAAGELLEVIVERQLAVDGQASNNRRVLRATVNVERTRRVEDALTGAAQQVRPPQALRDVRLRLSRQAAIGGDDDDAIRRLRAIDRRCRRALEDLDVDDVVRVEIREPVGDVVLGRTGTASAAASRHRVETRGNGRVAVDHAVDDDKRTRGAGAGNAAATLDSRAAAGTAGAR